jgi:hypothetical protein
LKLHYRLNYTTKINLAVELSMHTREPSVTLDSKLLFHIYYYYYYIILLAFTTHLRVLASSFLRFRDHTQGRTTVGRTSLDEWSVRRRDLYLTYTTLSTNIHVPGGIQTRNPSMRAAADPLLTVKTHIQRSGAERRGWGGAGRRGAGRSGAARPAACDLTRGNKSTALFPRIKSQAAGRSAVCVFLPLDRSATGIGVLYTYRLLKTLKW